MTAGRSVTVDGTLRRSARRTPARVAILYGERSWTYAELDDAVSRAARVLRDTGLETAHERADRRRLVAGRPIRRHELESIRHCVLRAELNESIGRGRECNRTIRAVRRGVFLHDGAVRCHRRKSAPYRSWPHLPTHG